jgi:hypothetical protein
MVRHYRLAIVYPRQDDRSLCDNDQRTNASTGKKCLGGVETRAFTGKFSGRPTLVPASSVCSECGTTATKHKKNKTQLEKKDGQKETANE